MKIMRSLLLTISLCLTAVYAFSQPCTSGCTITVSSSTTANYTVLTGQQLCITSNGVINGDITLSGGTICNQGLIQSVNFSINTGTINNYGTILQGNTLELKNTSTLTNYSGGMIKVSQKLIVWPQASYFAASNSQLLVYPFSTTPLMVNAGDPQTTCSSTSVTLGGQPTANGGTLPYTYSWAPVTGLNASNVANPVAKPSVSTTYTLTVTDGIGKSKISTVAVTVLSSPVANAGSPQTVCKGTTVTLGGSPSASGGATPYKYIWTRFEGLANDSIPNPTATPNYTTTYVLTVVDNNKCYGTSSAVITIKPEIAVFAGNDTTILKRDTMLLGGTPTANYGSIPFTYSWSPTTGLNSSTIANPKASPASNTTYVVTITDAGACGNKKDTVVVTVDPNQKVNAGSNVTICFHDTTTIGGSPTAKGGTLPYTYSWSPSTGLTSTSIANPKALPTITTSYVVTVTDAQAHVVRDTVVVTVKPLPVANAGNDNTVYKSRIVLGANPVASGGKPPYKYNWSSATNQLTFTDVANPYATLTDTTLFTLTVTDSNGCKSTDAVVINFNDIYGSACNLDSCTWVIDGVNSTNYTIGSGQKLCINPGATVNGNITISSGGRICNSGTFQPATLTFNGGLITNNATGIAKVTGNLNIPSGAGLTNDGSLEVTGYLQANTGSTFLNLSTILTSGRMLVKTVEFYNYGVITLNTTSLVIISPAVVTNYGAFRSIDTLKNSSTLSMADSAIIFTKHFYNYATGITKKIKPASSSAGGIMVCSRTENYGQINDTIDICDKSPSAGPVYLDVNTGTVQSSVRFCKTSFILKDSSEACGNCATLTLTKTGCTGDLITFKAISSKVFDNYEFLKNNVRVQYGREPLYTLKSPAVVGDVYTVIGTAIYSPCKSRTSNSITIQSKPIVDITGNSVATPSATLTATGATTYQWTAYDGTALGTTAALIVYPEITTSYIAYGTNSSTGCVATDTFEVKKPLQLSYISQNPSFLYPSSGSIHLNVAGGKYPLTYLWNTGSTSADLSSAAANTSYSVTVTDASGQTANTSIILGYGIAWGAKKGVTVIGSSITRTAPGNDWSGVGTVSATIIGTGQNGWTEFKVDNVTVNYCLGLTSSGNTPGSYATFDNAIGLIGGLLKIFEKGVMVASAGPAAIGDVMRVERIGSTISYKKNGTQVYSSSANAALSLMAATEIFSSGVSINGIQGGFSDLPADMYHGVEDFINPFPVCNGDVNRNFIQTINYDENGAVINERKVYSDYLGREIQTQTRTISDNNVIASQVIYDLYGRKVIQTLGAPIQQSDLCYKENFITNTAGANYSNSDFNLPDYTKSADYVFPGEVDRPAAVGNTIPNNLGWYYSDNNSIEAFTPTSYFPYSRIEYDDNNGGVEKRMANAGDMLSMGNNTEVQSYTIAGLNELDYVYGQNKCWTVEDYSDPNFDGQGTITPASISPNYGVMKTIGIDQNGLETVTFTDGNGKTLASCLSGQVNGVNVKTRQVTRTLRAYSIFVDLKPAAIYVDVHLPKGCENSLVIKNSIDVTNLQKPVYNILNLKTGQFVKFGKGIDFMGTQPNLPAGVYRIILKALTNPGVNIYDPLSPQFAFQITQNVNYYNFTANYYDKAGHLVLVVPPAGFDDSYAPAPNTTPIHMMISSTEYNSIGQVLSTITPDAGLTKFLYRMDGKLRFSQNAKQRASAGAEYQRRFSYINYDDSGRMVEAGEFDPSIAGSPGDMYFNSAPIPVITFSYSYIPVTGSIMEQTGINYIPERCKQQTFMAYDVETTAPLSYKQEYLSGKISKTWNVASTTWYGYDELGRNKWVIKRINDMPVAGSNTDKTINYKYDLLGNVTQIDYQKELPEDFYHYYEYDADKRLKRVLTSTDGITKQEQAFYTYYKHGPLKRSELANRVQGRDYVYTINGWLKSINSPELTAKADPGKDGLGGGPSHCGKDLFGMTLDYFAGDFTRANTAVQTYDTPDMYLMQQAGTPPPVYTELSKNLYNGTIKGQRWQTLLPDGAIGNPSVTKANAQLMYAYLYDSKYQLTSATFGTVNLPGTLNYNPIPVTPGHQNPLFLGYRGPTLNSGLTDYTLPSINYDLNGNIQALNRNGYATTSPARNADMDQLTYNYNKVVVGGIQRLINNRLRNVTDNIASNPYTTLGFYPNQAIDNYKYDQIGEQTEDNSFDPEFTTYDASGKVLAVYADAPKTNLKAMFTYDEKGLRLKKTDASGVDTWYIHDETGNTICTYQKIPGYSIQQKEIGIFGNKRLGTFSYNSGVYTYELADHLGSIRSTFTVDNKSSIKTYFDKDYKDDYLFTYNSTIDNTVNHTTSPTNKIASVKLNAQNQYGPLLNIPTPVKALQRLTGSIWFKTSGTTPSNAMIVFAIDDPITKQNISWQPAPCSVASFGIWTELIYDYTADKDGTLTIYPWNADPTQTVWFDDLTVNFETGKGIPVATAVTLSDYYPHGSVMPGRNYVSGSTYRYGYQGQFAEQDPETNKTSFELRQWNGLLGRWSSTDPYKQYHSPYVGMGNDLINNIDRDGGDADKVDGWIKGPDGDSYWDPHVNTQAEFDAKYGNMTGYSYQGQTLTFGQDWLGFFSGANNGVKTYLLPAVTTVASVGPTRKELSNSAYPGIKIYQNYDPNDWTAVTLPGFGIYIGGHYTGDGLRKVMQHEYGHYLDYKNNMPAAVRFPQFYLMIGVPSSLNAADQWLGGPHSCFFTEIRANAEAQSYFGQTYLPDAKLYPTK
jgi:RHS repeat-associated protein